MPFRTAFTRRIHLPILSSHHYDVYESRVIAQTYADEDANNERWLYGGIVLAINHTTQQYVPYTSGGTYGAGSDVPVCVTTEPYDMTYGYKVVTGVHHAQLIERNCYLYGGALGIIPAAVKTALQQINWT